MAERIPLPTSLQPFAPALTVLAAAFGEVPWRLGGSALLASHGLTDEVGDLDVTVAADALVEVQDRLGPWIVEVDTGAAPAPWCSDWIVRLDLDDIEVDVIGGFCVVAGTERVHVPQVLGGYLDVVGVTVPLADPGVWWWVYQAYKPQKAAMLEEVVPADRRAQLLRDLGPPPPPTA